MAGRLLNVTALNIVPAAYGPILRLQELLFDQRRAGLIPDTLLQLEHRHVYTMGKRGSPADFRADADALRAAGVSATADVFSIPRGGETTYHGPGQLVVYPIVSLRELGAGARAYVEGLEDVMVRTLGRYGISAQGRVPGKTGVWVGDRKIGAVGVRISQGVTSHGIALNVSTDLSYFRHIVPCGTPDKEVTSVQRQLAGQQQQGQPQAQRQQQGQQGQAAAALAAAAGSSEAALAAGVAARLPPLAAVPLPQVAACFLETFATHFGYNRLEPLPDVNQLAAELGCSDATSS